MVTPLHRTDKTIFSRLLIIVSLTLSVLCLVSVSSKRILTGDNIKAALLGHQIIPDVIPKSPKRLVKLSYIDGFTAKLGNILAPEIMRFPPFFISWPCENRANDTLYTLMMIDPDMPSRHQSFLGEYLHWLIGNMKGPDLETGNTIAEYISPEPEPDSGYHRYVFMVWEQPAFINYTDPQLNFDRNDTRRLHFSARKFAEKHKFRTPHAINFCLSAFNKSSIDGIDDLCESHGNNKA